MNAQPTLFDGPVYDPALDRTRLSGQIARVFRLMSDGQYKTLREIATATGDGEASISAQLRHLTKPKHGSHHKDKRRRGEETRGVWEYQVIPNEQVMAERRLRIA